MNETTTRRREYGAGSVFPVHRDGCPRPTNTKGQPTCRCPWRGTLEAGWSAAGGRRRLVRTGPTRASVEKKLRDLAAQLEAGAAQTSRVTVKTWADTWLPLAEARLRPEAYKATRSAVRRWIVPTIGHKRLEALTPGDVRAVSTAMRQAGRAGASQLRTHSVLTSMLRAALVEGLPVAPRLLQVDAPRRGSSDRTGMTPEEAILVLEQAAATPAGSRYVAALLQGIRQGEALGLCWDHVDLDAGVMFIEWQLKTLPYRVPRDRSSGFAYPADYRVRQLANAWHLVEVKTKAGVREVPIVPWMETSLRAWRDVAPYSPHGLVWPHLDLRPLPLARRTDGRPRPYKEDDAGWYALQDAAGVRHPAGRYYTIHEARHTTATLLLEASVDPKIVADVLGQTNILTTRGYQHIRTQVAREALGRMTERLQLN